MARSQSLMVFTLGLHEQLEVTSRVDLYEVAEVVNDVPDRENFVRHDAGAFQRFLAVALNALK
jgi:hypothetical protein